MRGKEAEERKKKNRRGEKNYFESEFYDIFKKKRKN